MEDPIEHKGGSVVMTENVDDSVMQTDPSNMNDKSLVSKVKSIPSSTLNGATAAANTKLKTEVSNNVKTNSTGVRSNLIKSTISSASRSVNSVPVPRRNSTGGLPEKQATSVPKKGGAVLPVTNKRASSITTDPLRKSLPEMRRSSVPSVSTLSTGKSGSSETKKSAPLSPAARTSRASVSSESSRQDSSKKVSVKPSPPSVTSTRRVPSTSTDSTSSIGSVCRVPKVSSPSSASRSPSVSSGSKTGLLDRSVDRSSSLSGRRKSGTPESRDSRFIMLPQVEVKGGDDMRLDLRGHRIRSLSNTGLNLSPNLEFVYLRDNLLSTLDGIETLHRVKVLDLSFNDFKGPGFEPLKNCTVLQQLYLAGNQITSLSSLPELANLEFLSVAQNKLKSLSMASQPRLQVLAASKNKISTLKGFPHLPALEHLRLEENPILLKIRHLEAASILLIGPTLKKFNDRDLSREEIAIAKRYPAHTALCIRGGWEFCRSEQAQDSTFKYLLEQWKEQLPLGYQLKKASVDRPFEGDACHCHFDFVKDNTESNKESTESSNPEVELKYQWFIGERTPSNFKAIHGATDDVYIPSHEDLGRALKVECIIYLGETEYQTIFAISSPVFQGTGQPKVLKIDVRGDLVEGNIIKGYAEVAWCGGTPGRGVASWLRRRWNSSPVVIAGAEDKEYKLSLDDVDSCLVYMYTPVTEEGTKGEPQYAITDYIKAAPPSVNNVRITGDAVEGHTIGGLGEYFGGREGPSRFEWLHEDTETGEYELVSSGTNEYPLTKEDVGRRLAFVYIPVNFEGEEGNSVSTVSQIIKKAPPKVTNVKIIGELKEGSKVTVTGTVTGGTEGSSRAQWFKTNFQTFEDENNLEALTASKIAKAFRVPLGAVGYYLVAKFTPMTPDGEAGESTYVLSEQMIATLPPSLNFLSITGDYIEGELLTASYGYVGGHEGKSIFNWYLHEVETDQGELIPEGSGLLQYCITQDAVGKFLSFTCVPVRGDGVIGESKTCTGQEIVRPGSPRLLSLQIVGTAVEGATLNVDKEYWGGKEGESVYRWFRSDSQGAQFEINDATSSSYTVPYDDIGFSLSVSCEPVRNDLARGPTLSSQRTGCILPGPPTCKSLEFSGSLVEGKHVSFTVSYSGGDKGNCLFEWSRVKKDGVKEKLKNGDFLDLTIDDVEACIELAYTPVRRDGVKGQQRTLISGPVSPGDPVGMELLIPECSEDKLVVPQKRYFGGVEDVGEYRWYRLKTKLEDSALMDIANSADDLHICGRTLTYTPSLLDVGAFLALYWLPTREDGVSGNPLISICEAPVTPGFPLVYNVRIKELSFNTYYGEGEYSGGYEGSSLFSWYRKSDEGTVSLIDGADSRTYEVTDEDYTCCLLFGYAPVRSDSTVGELKLSEPTNEILPEVPRIEMLALTGKAIEGDTLTALEIIPKSEAQQHTWSKYKKEISYQWFSSSDEFGESKFFEPLPTQSLCSYKPRLDDIGNCLRCQCIVTDVFGRSSEPVYAESSAILPGIPKIKKLEIEGRGFHTNLYAVRGNYSGGREGKSKIQWLRSMIGSPDLISIPGEIGRMYEANVDDVGYRLVLIYTPIREDGVEGQPISASTDPISVEPDVLKEVKQKLDLGSIKFEVLCNKDRSLKKGNEMGSLERRILEVNRKRTKVVKPGSKTSFPTTDIRGSYAPPFHVELFRNDQHRLRIVVDGENEVDLMVQTRHLRDVIVLVIRGLAQRFNSTSLNSLLKTETRLNAAGQ